MFCGKCGQEFPDGEKVCPGCGAPVSDQGDQNADGPDGGFATPGIINNGPMPPELKGWNWGAFFLSWIWAIAHNVWLGLLALVPYVGFIMMIVLGVKGSEWAWEKRQFNGADHFKEVQRIWAKWGLILFIVAFGLSIILGVISSLLRLVAG